MSDCIGWQKENAALKTRVVELEAWQAKAREVLKGLEWIEFSVMKNRVGRPCVQNAGRLSMKLSSLPLHAGVSSGREAIMKSVANLPPCWSPLMKGSMKMSRIDPLTGTMITGGSDDLIEIDGELREEFNSGIAFNRHPKDKYAMLALSDGTLLKVDYDEDGIWRFTVRIKGTLYDRKVEGSADDDAFDQVYFKPGLKWIVFSDDMQRVIAKRVDHDA